MALPSLREHNSRVVAEYLKSIGYPKPNGIACPKCEHELVDSTGETLLSCPAQTWVHCPACGHKDLRVL